tara:strand:+ start:3607 stop:4002 length:396 start_codon:yes stop_codon:yes gene_type:complete
MKKLTIGILASLSAAAVIATGAIVGNSANVSEPEPTATPAAVVVSVEENTLRQETPDTIRPTVVVPPAPVVESPAPPPAPEPAPEPETWVNDDGSVEGGSGCPSPYVDNGYGCQVPICGVDENGNDIACQG